MSSRTNCSKKVSLISALLFAVAALAATASAQTCLTDEYGSHNTCTANDVRIAFADNPRDLTGAPLPNCQAGGTFSFVADFHVTTTASARYNIGMYFATAGQSSALTGKCSDNIIAPPHASVNPLDTVTLGTSQYESLNPSPDNCGDITTADNNQVITVEVDNVMCKAGANGLLALPNCTSWQQTGGVLQCTSPAPNYPWVKAAVPGSPSKCNCDSTFTVPIVVQSPSVTVTKACTTANTSGTTNTTCDAGNEGGSVTYTVTVANSSNFGSVVVDQICDSAYGNIFTVGGFTGPACPAGSVGSVSAGNTTCSALTVASTPQSCTFTVTQGENATVKDIVNVVGHGTSGGGSFGPVASNQVTVTSEDAPSTATTTKSFVSNTNFCATVRYGVDVKNTSVADETLTLSGLNDSAFGDVTKVQGSVLGTTCGAAAQTGGVTLPVGGPDFTCTFNAQFCAAPSTVTKPDGTTCTGIQHTNTVTPALTGDEGETVSNSGGALTVTECISTF